MTTFRVGQRVRIKFCRHPREFGDLSGYEGTVTGHCLAYDELVGFCDSLEVRVDGLPVLRSDGCEYLFGPEQLEPLTDSNTLVSWESMRDLWVPEHLRVAV